MIQTCNKCSRVNPNDAIYCYYDGFVLGGHNRAGGPVAVGAMPFNSPFVFPDGHSCRSFNELARACQERWPEARMLLQKGLIESFLTGLGRLDLVMAAQEARKFPDPDRALDTLLARLPCDREALSAPQLKVEATEINLGVIEPGQDRLIEIRLENAGERLLYGDVSVQVPGKQQAWVSLDEKPGTTQRSFQFQEHQVLQVRLERDRVRASDKPLVATLIIDSSGGTATIQIKAEVPVKPFPDGALKGARSPKELALLAKKKPKEAAPQFESGDVSNWYRSNGWVYPVQGPASSGLAAIQQFFEALGLVQAPKVAISKKHINWSGAVGDSLEQEIVLQTAEKKSVYAHGTSDHSWVVADRAEVKGQRATIRVRVPRVPDNPGETLKATLTVQSNGDQRFFIPITLAVGGTPTRRASPSSSSFNFDEEPAAVVAVVEEEPVAVLAVADDEEPAAVVAVVEEEPVPVIQAVESVPQVREAPQADSDDPFGSLTSDAPAEKPRERAAAPTRGKPDTPAEEKTRVPKPKGEKFLGHLVPLLLLFLVLGGVVAWDYFLPPVAGVSSSSLPSLELVFSTKLPPRFGLAVVDPSNPKGNDPERKVLTPPVAPSGETSTVSLRVGGGREPVELFLGPGQNGSHAFGTTRRSATKGTMTIKYPQDDFEVTQEVVLVKGASDALDTCIVKYTIKNGRRKQIIGLRALIDTYIGKNDGVPFLIPGDPVPVTKHKVIGQKEMPEYIEAIENPKDPKNPGTVVRIGLKIPNSQLEDPSRVIICGFKDGFNLTRSWELEPRKDIEQDSCVLLYWPEVEMNPGDERVLGYTYGLAEVVSDGSLALSAPAVVTPNSEFTLTAYVYNAKKGTPYTVALPKGLELAEGESNEKKVEADGDRVTLYWKVRAGAATKDVQQIFLGGGGARSRPVKVQIRDRSIFG